ncbi:hypothetical protein BX659_10359 [Orenia metallireducens]|uniref:DUF945 domain-containing protein n=1 Tax=Orenia metallireducens TaxID=1413210 RepID=A0A285FGM3_9FIRM|nr:hypothetical protein [Orenia metallireducens]PRX33539.1 hypothetical protein BX659_10359 [Orenia metallireducens]SNY10442.1 hypothetical protein SAMN06265827_10259 [Orenia metallireducens]
MDKNSKVLLGTIVILVVIVLGANWYLGNIVEDRLTESLELELKKGDIPFDVEYSRVVATPLLSQVTYHQIMIKDKDYNNGFISIDKMVVKLPYQDSFMLAKEDKLKELHGLVAKIDNLKVEDSLEDLSIGFEQLSIDYKGQLPLKRLEDDFNPLLQDKQAIAISFSGFNVELPDNIREKLSSAELENKLTKIDEFIFDFDYNPAKKEVKLNNYKVDSPLFFAEASEVVHYNGNSLEDLEITDISGEGTFEFKGDGVEFGNPETTGRYTLGNITTDSKFNSSHRQKLIRDDMTNPKAVWVESIKNIGDGEYNFTLEGFKAEFAGRLKEQLSYNPLVFMGGIDLSNLALDELTVDYKVDNNNINISNAKLNSSILDMEVAGNFDINREKFSESSITTLTLRVAQLNDNLAELVSMLEMRMGQKLPRDGEDILLNLNGTFANPKIEGMDI